MSRTKDLFPRAEPPSELRSFYVPHARVQYTGELVDHRTGEIFTPPSRTKQSFVAECDINNIIKSYSVTGQLRHINQRAAQGTYADLPEPQDFQESLNQVKEAQAAFLSLPSHVRSRFGNEPAEFLAFMADPANQDEIIKLGLATDNRPSPPPPPPPSPNPAPEAK